MAKTLTKDAQIQVTLIKEIDCALHLYKNDYSCY